MENDRITDLLQRIGDLGISRKAKAQIVRSPPIGVSLHLDRTRLKKLGVKWTPEAIRASNYAHWLRGHERFVCCYCSQPIPQTRRARHADHIIPLSRGGQHVAENIAPACQQCNQTKRALLLTVRPRIAPHLSIDCWQPAPVPPQRIDRSGVRGPNDWDEEFFAAWCAEND